MFAVLSVAEAPLVIPSWAWAAFLGFVGLMLALDLGVFKKNADQAPSFKEAVAWCVVWVSLAVGFAFLLSAWRGPEDAELFAAGYVLELALSVDNLFIFILVFAHFGIPERLQHRVLFWGILGAVAMRAVFIIVGVAAVESFALMLPLFGAFLLFTGVKMAFSHDESEGKGVDENFIVRMTKKFLPVTNRLHGDAFWVKEDGRGVFTPLFVVLLVIEGTDLLFAVDSIPAVLGILPTEMAIEEKRFIAFTSNIFAIMGLRSMYFAISGFMHYFRFLKPALSFILVFIGLKMILPWAAGLGQADSHLGTWVPSVLVHEGKVHVPTSVSLSIIGFILALAIGLSVAFPKKK
ncbi:MAG: TerC/Alx family metal homeostasis membrane protein [Verrucomicrobiota bacterium]